MITRGIRRINEPVSDKNTSFPHLEYDVIFSLLAVPHAGGREGAGARIARGPEIGVQERINADGAISLGLGAITVRYEVVEPVWREGAPHSNGSATQDLTSLLRRSNFYISIHSQSPRCVGNFLGCIRKRAAERGE